MRTSRAPALAVALSCLTIGVLLVVPLGAAYLAAQTTGVLRYVYATIAVLTLWVVARPARRNHADHPEVPEASAPHLFVAVHAAYRALGGPGQVRVQVTPDEAIFATAAVNDRVLVISLPRWTALDPPERLAAITHALAFAGHDGGSAAVVAFARSRLLRILDLLVPPKRLNDVRASSEAAERDLGHVGPGERMAEHATTRDTTDAMGNAGLSVMAAPFRLLLSAIDRLWVPRIWATILAADAEAVRIAGTEATRAWLLSSLGIPRGVVAAEVAARRGQDPFVALTTCERPDAAEVQRRLDADRRATRTRTDRELPISTRIAALDRLPEAGAQRGLAVSMRRADAELDGFRESLRSRYRDRLLGY